ncbi:S1 family peptidase [Streptomyces virginiae]|uniref:S1 family peptidase n=1 Tax=Streptomyces virginiae TaxID=1961 RepID=UPI0036828117
MRLRPVHRPTSDRRSARRRALTVRVAAASGAAAVLGATLMTGSASAIVNGEDSTERYSFMASIPLSFPLEDGVVLKAGCGATLIDRQWVLTAGHCMDPHVGVIQEGLVRVGSAHRTSGGTVRKVDKVVMHPGYALGKDGTPNENDLALVRLDRPVAHRPIRIAKQAGPVGAPTRILGFGTVVGADFPKTGCSRSGSSSWTRAGDQRTSASTGPEPPGCAR